MYEIKKFTVVPAIPEPLADLRTLALNLWWTWNYEAVTLFHRLDRRLWGEVKHNPVRLLAELSQERLEQVANDPAYLAHKDRVMAALSAYLSAKTWFDTAHPEYRE